MLSICQQSLRLRKEQITQGEESFTIKKTVPYLAQHRAAALRLLRDKRHLGIHSELISDCIIDLVVERSFARVAGCSRTNTCDAAMLCSWSIMAPERRTSYESDDCLCVVVRAQPSHRQSARA